MDIYFYVVLIFLIIFFYYFSYGISFVIYFVDDAEITVKESVGNNLSSFALLKNSSLICPSYASIPINVVLFQLFSSKLSLYCFLLSLMLRE